MTKLEDNRLVRVMGGLRQAGKKTLLPFITAGFPDLRTTLELLRDFERRGVSVCELGVPYSDPVADGPVIQASYTKALDAGVTSRGIMDTIAAYRKGGGSMAMVLMVSNSIVFRHGLAEYLDDAVRCGADGLIVPDLPLDEAQPLETAAAKAALANVMLIAPTTPPARRLEIARHSRGFIYFISVAGITGERDSLPQQTIDAVAELRTHTGTPVCVGFGIARPSTAAAVCRVADGAIVGSAIVHRIADAAKALAPREQLVEQVGRFVGELLAAATERPSDGETGSGTRERPGQGSGLRD